MKSAKLLLATAAVLLASSAWAQTLPRDTEIKVRTRFQPNLQVHRQYQ
jgi:hypothetical protein